MIRGAGRLHGKRMDTRIVKSSGNVFEDLGFSASEAEDLQLRSDFLIEVQIFADQPQRKEDRVADGRHLFPNDGEMADDLKYRGPSC